MMNLLQYIFTKLSETQKPVYLEVSPSDAVYPYIVFSIPNIVIVESDRQDYTLVVNVWDNQSDTTALEVLTSELDKKLNKLEHLDSTQFIKFERENRLMIPDADSEIRRRQLRYTVKQYER